MKLKKINEALQNALIEKGLTEANELQQETFSTIKSGADCLIVAPKGSGKSTTIVLNVIQQLAGKQEESPRALIIVERDSQKGILIGKGGEMLKRIGRESRLEIEKFIDQKVFMETFVKVDKDWRSTENKLKKYGY